MWTMALLALEAVGEMSTPTIILVLTLVFGNGTFLTILLTGFFNRRKVRSESVKIEAETDQTAASTTEALVRTSLSLLEPYTQGLARFSAEAERLQEENELLRRQQVEMNHRYAALEASQQDLIARNAILNRQLQSLSGRIADASQAINDVTRRTE